MVQCESVIIAASDRSLTSKVCFPMTFKERAWALLLVGKSRTGIRGHNSDCLSFSVYLSAKWSSIRIIH